MNNSNEQEGKVVYFSMGAAAAATTVQNDMLNVGFEDNVSVDDVLSEIYQILSTIEFVSEQEKEAYENEIRQPIKLLMDVHNLAAVLCDTALLEMYDGTKKESVTDPKMFTQNIFEDEIRKSESNERKVIEYMCMNANCAAVARVSSLIACFIENYEQYAKMYHPNVR
jgi:hypothetical protein